MRIDGVLYLTVPDGEGRQELQFSAEHVAAILNTAQRGSQRVTYETTSNPATVYYTALDTDASTVITPRVLVTLQPVAGYTGYRLYAYDQPITHDPMTDFIVLWDEGNPAVYKAQWVVVDTRAGSLTPVVISAPPPNSSVPGIPLSVAAVAGNAQATVTWTAPADDGGSPLISFVVTAADSDTPANGGQSATVPATDLTATVGGLTNGDHYTFKVQATNGIGTGASSAASNSVLPAVQVVLPTQPLSPSAVGGNGQATVTFSAPFSNGGASITSYTVTAHDETVPGTPNHSGASSPITITGLTNNHTYYFTVTAHNSVGEGPQSVATNTVVPNPTGSGAGIATFSYSQVSSSTVSLDATGSVGTLIWNVDGIDSFVHTTTMQIGPLVVGSHTIKLTATGSTVAVTQQDVDVAWIGKPLGSAQHDSVNGISGWWGPGAGPYGGSGGIPDGLYSTTNLPQWSPLPAIGPWRNKATINTASAVPPGDGVARISVISDNEIALLTKWGDHPGNSGGYRSSMEWTNSYAANISGLPFATSKNIDCCGEGVGNGHDGRVRFYRIEMYFPSTNPTPLLYQNNSFEIHGTAGGSSPVRFQTNGAGTQFMWALECIQNGVSGGQKTFDSRNILQDTWYNYVVELLLSLDPTVGYMRVWRDGSIVTGLVPPGTITAAGPDQGKFFGATQQTTSTGSVVSMAFDAQNYRTRSTMPSNYPDVVVHYRNINVGPTMASVMIP